MNFHKPLAATLIGATLLIAACNSDNDPLPATGSAAVAEELITGSTSETALPVPINSLETSADDISETALPAPI